MASQNVDAEDSVAYWMVQHQEPLVFPFEGGERRFPQATAYLESQGSSRHVRCP